MRGEPMFRQALRPCTEPEGTLVAADADQAPEGLVTAQPGRQGLRTLAAKQVLQAIAQAIRHARHPLALHRWT
jgi:hypothetical protein